MNLYDRVVEMLLLVGVWGELIIAWKLLQERQRNRLTRAFNRLMRRIGV